MLTGAARFVAVSNLPPWLSLLCAEKDKGAFGVHENSSRLTVFFEDPFWVGIYERQECGAVTACRIVFGPEPKDYEVYQFLLENWKLLTFGPAVADDRKQPEAMNPKRRQREIQRAMDRHEHVGTKAQQALKLQQEQGKQIRKAAAKQKRDQEQERQFLLKQEKRKEKRRGH